MCSQRNQKAPRLVTNVMSPEPKRVCDRQDKIASELKKIERKIQADLARNRENARIRFRELQYGL